MSYDIKLVLVLFLITIIDVGTDMGMAVYLIKEQTNLLFISVLIMIASVASFIAVIVIGAMKYCAAQLKFKSIQFFESEN
jgi:hypothetical protein